MIAVLMRVVKSHWIGLVLLCFASHDLFAQNQSVVNFREAKGLLRQIHSDQRVTFYCGCTYERNKPAFDQCGYKPKQAKAKLASRIEWEHIVPASKFGRSFTSWTQGDVQCVSKAGKPFKGRKCARKVSPRYNQMAADLYNLHPVIGEVNALRRNYPFADIPGEAREFGRCDIEIDNQTVEPDSAIRGDIARIYLYMATAYEGRAILTLETRARMTEWSATDPVDDWECERNRRIRVVQKSSNPILDRLCQAHFETSSK